MVFEKSVPNCDEPTTVGSPHEGVAQLQCAPELALPPPPEPQLWELLLFHPDQWGSELQPLAVSHPCERPNSDQASFAFRSSSFFMCSPQIGAQRPWLRSFGHDKPSTHKGWRTTYPKDSAGRHKTILEASGHTPSPRTESSLKAFNKKVPVTAKAANHGHGVNHMMDGRCLKPDPHATLRGHCLKPESQAQLHGDKSTHQRGLREREKEGRREGKEAMGEGDM